MRVLNALQCELLHTVLGILYAQLEEWFLSIMITVSKPHKEERGGLTYLLSRVVDETRQWDNVLWFSVAEGYGEGLCDDYADAFLLLVLLPAIKSGQDIRVEGRVSRKLLFNIRNTVQPIFNRVLDAPRDIRIEAQAADDILYHGKGVGCGCSLGVDSLNAFFEHFNPDTTEGYRATHLTLFNSGHFGDTDLESAETIFLRSVKELEPFSKAVQLPVLAVDSNMSAFYLQSGITFLQSFVTRTCACALAMQKLLGRYVYASSYDLPQLEFSTFDCSHMEATYVPLLSTENFELTLSNPMKTRVDKTNYIRTNPLTPKFLQVCWAEQMAYNRWHNTTYLDGKTKTNCGWCDKCLRTLLTLEILQGDISMYGETFELARYQSHKDEYLRNIFRKYPTNTFYREIIELIIERNYPAPEELLEQYRREQAGVPQPMPPTPKALAGKVRRFVRRALRSVHYRVERLSAHHVAIACMYRLLVVPLLVTRFIRRDKGATLRERTGTWNEYWHRAENTFSSEPEMRALKRDIVASWILYQVDPEEYFMYGFKGMPHKERRQYLSDWERWHACHVKMGWEPFRLLQDKAEFYRVAHAYFKREACPLANEEDWEKFDAFTNRHPRFFLKANAGTLGQGCRIVETPTDKRSFFLELVKSGSWLAEELVVQADVMAEWNPSSINTVRICSFRRGEEYSVVYPLLRTGRKGCVVDNGGAGGIFASIDPDTGTVVTDGADEGGHRYPVHPDSGKPYKGEQIPRWNELLAMVPQIHGLLPESTRYVAFDVALTAGGWVLIEGNWGQLLMMQIALQQGLRGQFEKLMGVRKGDVLTTVKP